MASVAELAGASEALLYRYFGSKAGLYVEVIRATMATVGERQRQATAALPADATARDRVATSLSVYLDHVALAAEGWASPFLMPGNDPAEAVAARNEIRAEYVDALRALFGPGAPNDYVLNGYFGFLDAACLVWVTKGYPDRERPALLAACLAALFGPDTPA